MRRDAISDPQALGDYIDGVWALKRLPASDDRYSRYDWFVLWHASAMMASTPPGNSANRNAAHSGPVFLPWHRYYLSRIEAEIAAVLGKPQFRLPYWNWLTDGAMRQQDQPNAPIWDDDKMGGTGYPVRTGPFRFDLNTPDASTNWVVRIEMRSRTSIVLTRRGLNRNIAGGDIRRLPGGTGVKSALSRTAYDRPGWDRNSARSFRNELEGWRGPPGSGTHNRVHRWISGDMSLGHSPNDPIFFLHHCNVDRIWAFWQSRNGANTYAPDQNAPDDLASHRLGDRLFQRNDDDAPPVLIDRMLSDIPVYDSFTDLMALEDSIPVA